MNDLMRLGMMMMTMMKAIKSYARIFSMLQGQGFFVLDESLHITTNKL